MSLEANRLSRRHALTLVATASAATLLSACGVSAPTAAPTTSPAKPAAAPTPASAAASTPASAAGPTPAAAAASAGQPRTGGTLRVGAVGDVATLDGHSWGPKNGFSIFMIYDTLTNYDEKLQPTPQLAESWDRSADSKQLTLNLRKGVQFHTGREMTSEDVIYNLQRPLDPKLQSSIPSFTILPGFVPPGTTFEAKDKYSVVIRSEQPWVGVFDYLQVLNIIDKETAEGPDAKTKAVGTGPFTFVEWAQGQHLKFAKNPNYWQSGRPYLDGVTVNIKADAQAMVTELEAGASDVVLAPTWRDFGRLKADPRYQTIKVAQPSTFHQFQPNVTFKPLDNKLVRQALSYAIDRKRIVDSVFLGETTSESLPWLPSSPAYEAEKQNFYTFDLDKAKALLGQAGINNLTLDLVYTTSDPAYAQMGEIYNSDLAKIGVTLTLKSLAVAQLLDTIQKQTYNGLYTLNDPWANMEPITLFTSSSSAQHKKNNGGYKNDQYTEMVNTVATEADPLKRKALYSKLNDFLLDEAFHMPVTQSPGRVVAAANVKGIDTRQMDRFMLTNTWLA
jgi:peptide/nickel transport system substrate-binding protein